MAEQPIEILILKRRAKARFFIVHMVLLMMKPMRVLVLGAGIQGVCVALALRQRGYRVALVDRMPDLMLRTSLRNEGKIHLGFVYANDATFQTAPLMLRAALCFAPLFEEWLESDVNWRELSSLPFCISSRTIQC